MINMYNDNMRLSVTVKLESLCDLVIFMSSFPMQTMSMAVFLTKLPCEVFRRLDVG